jgi:hypothetical protein
VPLDLSGRLSLPSRHLGRPFSASLSRNTTIVDFLPARVDVGLYDRRRKKANRKVGTILAVSHELTAAGELRVYSARVERRLASPQGQCQ